MLVKLSRRAAGLGVAASLALTLFTASAEAAVPAPRAAMPSAAGDICHDAEFGGDWYCDFGKRYMTWRYPDGQVKQIFVVGTDYAVWTRWKRADDSVSGWVSLGGEVIHSGDERALTRIQCTGFEGIEIIGTNGGHYWNTRYAGQWSGWYRVHSCYAD